MAKYKLLIKKENKAFIHFRNIRDERVDKKEYIGQIVYMINDKNKLERVVLSSIDKYYLTNDLQIITRNDEVITRYVPAKSLFIRYDKPKYRPAKRRRTRNAKIK